MSRVTERRTRADASEERLDRLTRREPGLVKRTIARLLREPGGVMGLSILALLIAAALLAQFIAPYDPLEIGADIPLVAPSPVHWFGTDNLGRDELSRIIFGARISLIVSIFSACGGLVMALPLGMLAGYFGGRLDQVISRFLDTIFAFPAVLLGVALVAALGSSLSNVVVAVAIISVPRFGRLVRVSVLSERHKDYVESARSVGATVGRILTRHILPNVIPPLIVQMTVVMAEAILLEAAFSFLGLGSRPPTPSWGVMLNEGRAFLAQAPWLGLFPGIAITILVLGLNALGDALEVAMDPRRF